MENYNRALFCPSCQGVILELQKEYKCRRGTERVQKGVLRVRVDKKHRRVDKKHRRVDKEYRRVDKEYNKDYNNDDFLCWSSEI